MCPFCSGGPTLHIPVGAQQRPQGKTFKSLRLSPSEFARQVPVRLSPGESMLSNDAKAPKLRIVAENEGAKEVLRLSSGATGQDWVDVPYSQLDSILWIMQRLEKVIRIPMGNWFLTGGGVIFSPGHLVMSLEHFKRRGNKPIEAVLLPAWDVHAFSATNLKTHVWKYVQLDPLSAVTPGTSARTRAEMLFPLIDTVDSPHWPAYITHRQNADRYTAKKMEEMKGEDMDPYWRMMKDAIMDALLGEVDLEDDDCERIADAISVLECEVSIDGNYEVRDAEVLVRIHSLVAPRSVDVHFSFHHRMRQYTVEWAYALGFRINSAPAPPPRTFRSATYDVDQQHAARGWRPFGWFHLDKRRAEHSACPVSARDLQEVHDALFGEEEAGRLGDRVSLLGTARLLLASVGMNFAVALDEEDRDENGDGLQPPPGCQSILDVDSDKPGVSAAHLRKICGIEPLEDDDPADLTQDQVTEPMDGSDDEGPRGIDEEVNPMIEAFAAAMREVAREQQQARRGRGGAQHGDECVIA